MVKSKKMSKTSIAVIVLAILLVLSLTLGLTGAWFTSTASDTSGTQSSLKLGSIGNVSITVTDAAWTKGETSSRTYVMPGDTVTCGSIEIAYAANTSHANSGAADEDVYYIIYDGTTAYSLTGAGTGNLVPITNNEAIKISAGFSASTAAQYATTDSGVAINGTGSAIGNVDQESDVNYTAVGFEAAGVTYKILAIQSSNLTAGTAYTELVALY